jgi:hypothetical protein
MLCYLCGKQIGLLRSIVDQQYCSPEHRREARLASARVLREEDDEQELWSVSKTRKKQQARPAAASGQTSAVAFLTLAALLVAMVMLPGGRSTQGTAFPPPTSPAPERGLFSRGSDVIGSFVRERAPITLHHDFQNGLNDWVTVALSNAAKVDDPHDWKTPASPSVVIPGSLRLWSRSTPLRNYQMDFAGQIERKSLSWAFRASNAENYYAAKIEITRPGPQPNADLIHYVMLNGREWDRVQLPLPLTLERGSEYLVRVSVQDDHFITSLNGQVISSWSDGRLSRGGIGFFSDGDDEQQVAWVSLSERDSIMGRMLAHFGLFIVPAPLP